MANFFGPFGDMYRRDKRAPHVGEAYLDINPEDARAINVNDGDYVWVDGDPADTPSRAGSSGRPSTRGRLLCRARYYPGTPKGIMRMWHNGYMATPGLGEGPRDAPRRPRQEPGDELPGVLPLWLAPEPHSLVAQADPADADPRHAQIVDPRGDEGLQRRRPPSPARPARRCAASPRPRTAASAARGCGDR